MPTGGCLRAEAWANGLKIAWAGRRAIFSLSGGPSQFPGQRPLGQGGSGGLGAGGPTLRGPHASWASPPSRPRGQRTASPGEDSWGRKSLRGLASLGGGGGVARGHLSSTQPPPPSCPGPFVGRGGCFLFWEGVGIISLAIFSRFGDSSAQAGHPPLLLPTDPRPASTIKGTQGHTAPRRRASPWGRPGAGRHPPPHISWLGKEGELSRAFPPSR